MSELQLADDLRIHYAEWGDPDAPAVVLLHPFMWDLRSWFPVIAPLAQEYRVLAMDLRGHGGSSAPEAREEYAIELLAEDLRALLDSEGIDVCALVGSGLGGMVALQFAVDKPERLAGLAVADAGAAHMDDRYPDAYRAYEAELEEHVAVVEKFGTAALGKRLAADVEDEFLRAGLARRYAALNADGVLGGAYARRTRPDLFPLLSDRLAMPVLVLAGEESPLCQPVQLMAGEIAACRTVLVRDTEDCVLTERPDAFAHALMAFLCDIEEGNEISGRQLL